MKHYQERLPSDRLLQRCAEAWDLSNFTFVRKMENIVYSCDQAGGKVFLRLTPPLRRSRREIEAELNWISHLSRSGLNVPHIVANKMGDTILTLDENDQHFEAIVCKEVTGEHPSEKVVQDPIYLRKFGALIAKMHNASHDGAHREQWHEERGLRHALMAIATTNETALKARFEDALRWMHSLPKTPETYGLVHADLGALNLFVDADHEISVIDFDDSCYHWFSFDIAIAIYSMAGRFSHKKPEPIEQTWLKNLLEGYRSVRPLSEEQERHIPKFMQFALLRLIFWFEHLETLQTFHDSALTMVKETKQWAITRVT